MSEFRSRILVSALATLCTAPVGYVARRAIGASRILDPLSDWLGEWLRTNTTAQVEWVIAGIITAAAYVVALWFIWRHFPAPVWGSDGTTLARKARPHSVHTDSRPWGWKANLLLAVMAIGFVAIAGYFIWHSLETQIPLEITKEFEAIHTPKLGNPLRRINTTTDVYLAAHEHAIVISLLPILDLFVLPSDQGQKVIRQHDAKWDVDRKWFDDAYLRPLFRTPKGKNPPEYRLAEQWFKSPEQWKWVGWREWSCSFWKDTFYYQVFENGIIVGVLPTSEILGYGQIFVVLNNGEWFSKVSSIDPPACRRDAPTVAGVPIHGRFVK